METTKFDLSEFPTIAEQKECARCGNIFVNILMNNAELIEWIEQNTDVYSTNYDSDYCNYCEYISERSLEEE